MKTKKKKGGEDGEKKKIETMVILLLPFTGSQSLVSSTSATHSGDLSFPTVLYQFLGAI